jgi:predicted RNase H-like nuclease (RuvC/YqgF family)
MEMVEVEFTPEQKQELYQLGYSNEWFLKKKHQELVLDAWVAIDGLNENLHCALSRVQEANDSLKKEKLKNVALEALLVKEKQDNKEANEILEAANNTLNKGVENYEKSLNRLEEELKEAKKFKELYDNLRKQISQLLE